MIHSIVYDVGYVLVGYTWREGFGRLGYDEEGVKRLGEKIFGTEDPRTGRKWWEEYDMNRITDQELEDFCYSHFPEDKKALDWFFSDPSVYSTFLTDMTETVGRMKRKGYGTYLLSNYPKTLWKSHLKNAPFLRWLDGAVVSWEVGYGKPEERFYHLLLERYHLKVDECLFLDDRADNTAAAQKVGFHTFTLSSQDNREKAIRYLDRLPNLAEG